MILMNVDSCLAAFPLIVLEVAVERRLRDAEHLRCLRLVSCLFHYLVDQRLLHPRQYRIAAGELDSIEEGFDHLLERAERSRLDAFPVLDDIGGQVLGKDRVLLRDYHEPVDRVLQLPDVARPVVLGQVGHRLRRDALRGSIVQAAVHGQEVVAEKLDILPAFDEPGDPDREDVDPVVKVRAERVTVSAAQII